MRIRNHFHINGLALSLTLKHWLGATQEWPISLECSCKRVRRNYHKPPYFSIVISLLQICLPFVYRWLYNYFKGFACQNIWHQTLSSNKFICFNVAQCCCNLNDHCRGRSLEKLRLCEPLSLMLNFCGQPEEPTILISKLLLHVRGTYVPSWTAIRIDGMDTLLSDYTQLDLPSLVI